ncbi:uncharacterized protein LOC115626422 [Scaptodrosophila lebanonensis]|uniref:Uncharacterized protein LOC115626422 n=1 Tax=Drosophila lebanonensis TaxID=7225 RepID=A0A6J2TM58_DROLE|nr:uncharacterized protein LOC115626422 [Scaptodrosophila lebanonensis]
MPETNNRRLYAPSTAEGNGHAHVHGQGHILGNRLATNLTAHVTSRPTPVHAHAGRSQRRHGDATDFTEKQEMTLKAGDMRMARIQVSLSQLRVEMEQANKTLEELCTVARVDKERTKTQ